MAIYRCTVCGAIYDEEKEGKPFSELTGCPVCKQTVSKMVRVDGDNEKPALKAYSGSLDYDA